MEEIFDINNTSIAKSEFKLGITSCTDVGSMVSDDKTHAAFVRNGSLYSYSVDDNKLTEVFTFDEEKTDYIRDCYNKHDIKILSMDATGFMYFMVYGYMNRGEYEGRVAIILYTYDPATSLIEEKAYIPLDTTYDILKEQLSDFAYCNSREVFYFGLYDSGKYWDTGDLTWEIEDNKYVIDEVWEMYGVVTMVITHIILEILDTTMETTITITILTIIHIITIMATTQTTTQTDQIPITMQVEGMEEQEHLIQTSQIMIMEEIDMDT
jgi:hypothetical protein